MKAARVKFARFDLAFARSDLLNAEHIGALPNKPAQQTLTGRCA
jgi:hypothetical protein